MENEQINIKYIVLLIILSVFTVLVCAVLVNKAYTTEQFFKLQEEVLVK